VDERTYDLAIVGGGINGCGIARDAAGRGLSVLLLEQADLAGATSSASTKLIHGGLRYLEYYEFRLVREALGEREILLQAAPHIIRPMRFVLPHHSGLRPAWMIRAGLFLYDHLGGRKLLPASRGINLKRHEAGAPLKADFVKGFEYSDCWVEDSRLVVLNALDASERGADIRVRTRCETATREADGWKLTYRDVQNGTEGTARAKILVNAAGPWVSEFLTHRVQNDTTSQVRLVKGSHIIVDRLFDHDMAYLFQNKDGRVVFAIPYECDFTLIGTTDVEFDGDPGDVRISPQEVDYLCGAVSEYFIKPVTPQDVVHTYSGVRPLFDDGADDAKAATRDYVLELDDTDGAPLISLFGGKITTYRELAEATMAKLAPYLPDMSGDWTRPTHLPGGDFPVDGHQAIATELMVRSEQLEPQVAERWAHTYGTRAAKILSGKFHNGDLGQHFGAGLYEAEICYLIDTEWVKSAEDVVWRRNKLGLRMGQDEVANLDKFIKTRLAEPETITGKAQ